MIINSVMVLAGFFLLIRGADYFVTGTASIARKLGIPALIVGLTIVAIGTSAPELCVNVIAVVRGAFDLSIGNIMGSNLVNIMVALGLATAIVPLKLKQGTVWKEIPFALLVTFIVLVFGSDFLFDGTLPNVLSRTDGMALIALFLIFIAYTFGMTKSGEQPEEHIEVTPWLRSLTFTLGGMTALILGGYITVEGAVQIATTLGISQNLIGLTIVAIGTSLPEIVTTVIAAKKGHIDLAVGGIVGSNIFNILLILGVSATIHPLTFSLDSTTDTLVVACMTLLLFFFMFIGKRHTLDRKQGILFIILYGLYVTFAIFRG
ncbi:hypothetical protein A2239_02225 [Candidatus Uhrbacteria bacterium RIFOXYA2_FULL_40_9]|nr:MAG: hypothetical protein A2239_02225 [Candidatus Uhrbacteria bacterium RIFOXYA2_FULL_40_9]OGL97009.1 MAG: hypothetical protein A2332_04030 [Candidatus Uhrbacteria bacterium RIFOXYB2_FULL_41_18]